MSAEKIQFFPIKRIIWSLILLLLVFLSAKITLTRIPGEMPCILYFFSPVFFGHFAPILFCSFSPKWDPIDKWLPASLQCGKDRTLQGTLLIFSVATILYFIRYLFYYLGIWKEFELKVRNGTAFFQLPFIPILIILVIIFSILGDLVCHGIEKRLNSFFIRKVITWTLWHIDNLIGAIAGLFLYSALTGFWPVGSVFDWILSLIVYLFIHIAVDQVIHWNSRIGLKFIADKQIVQRHLWQEPTRADDNR